MGKVVWTRGESSSDLQLSLQNFVLFFSCPTHLYRKRKLKGEKWGINLCVAMMEAMGFSGKRGDKSEDKSIQIQPKNI